MKPIRPDEKPDLVLFLVYALAVLFVFSAVVLGLLRGYSDVEECAMRAGGGSSAVRMETPTIGPGVCAFGESAWNVEGRIVCCEGRRCEVRE